MKVRIEAVYEAKKGPMAAIETAYMAVKEAVLLAEDMEKTGRMKQFVFIDPNGTSWSKKELKKLTAELKEEPHEIVVFFDGGFDLETKKSGLGIVIYYRQNNRSYRIRKNALVEQLETNNEAEYAALHLSMQQLQELGVSRLPVTFIGDSQVVINQLNDEWPCFEEELNRWIDRIEESCGRLQLTPTYELIPRTKNKEADKLASQALKGVQVASHAEINNS